MQVDIETSCRYSHGQTSISLFRVGGGVSYSLFKLTVLIVTQSNVNNSNKQILKMAFKFQSNCLLVIYLLFFKYNFCQVISCFPVFSSIL